MTRLTAVELRKATDTRAGFWLQLATGAITLAAVAILLMSATEWAHVGTTLVAWLAISLAIGARRLVRGEIR